MNHFRPITHIDTFDLVASLREIASVEVSGGKGRVRDRMSMFDDVKLRQTYPGTAHKDTRTIYLRGPKMPNAETWFEDCEHISYEPLTEWMACADTLQHISRALYHEWFPHHPRTEPEIVVGVGDIAKAMIVELAPGGIVQWHKDEGPYADKHHRFHLPLVTNPYCLLISGNEHLHVPVGQLTWFDNHVMHSAVNLGTTPRYHLIVDYRIAA